MTEMTAARCAGHLDAVHAVAVVVVQLDIRPVARLGKARPASPGIELRLRREQLRAAAGAAVDAAPLLVHVLSRKRAFGPLSAQHLVLRRGERLSPLALALRDPRAVDLVRGIGVVSHTRLTRGSGEAAHRESGGSPRRSRTAAA